MTRLQRWLDRRMFERLAAYEERSAALCRANSLSADPVGQGPIPGRQFWIEEVDRYLDRANSYRKKAKALR